jgi:hypothetical protein
MESGTVSVGFGAAPAIDPELERLYRMRMSLPPEQRAEVERQYEAYLASKRPSAGPESLDPVEAAAFDVPDDPDVYADRQPAYSQEALERAANTASGYADRPAYSDASLTDAAEDPADYAQRPVYSEAGLEAAANMPPSAGPSGYADRQPAYSDRNLGAAARGPMPQPRVLQADVPGRVRELVARGMDPAMAQVVAEAEINNPRNPNDPNPTHPAVRAAIAAENASRSESAAAGQGTWDQKNEREYGEDDRMRQELTDARDRGSPDARLYMPETADWSPETAGDRAKWQEWATGGSLGRMARYAPEEFNRREAAAQAQRQKENAAERAARYDTTVDPNSGKTQGQLYREKQQDDDTRRLRGTDEQANRALYRELARMGIDPDQFGDPRSQYDRNAALNAKTKARESGNVGGRAGAVIRRAQAQQNPAEYAGRSDINDWQKMIMADRLLRGGAGQMTPLGVQAVGAQNAIRFLQGSNLGQGLDNPLTRAQAGAAQLELEQRRNSMRAGDEDVLGEKYAPSGYFGYDEFTVDEQQQMYDDLIAQGYRPAEAQMAVDRQAQKRRASERRPRQPAK